MRIYKNGQPFDVSEVAENDILIGDYSVDLVQTESGNLLVVVTRRQDIDGHTLDVRVPANLDPRGVRAC